MKVCYIYRKNGARSIERVFAQIRKAMGGGVEQSEVRCTNRNLYNPFTYIMNIFECRRNKSDVYHIVGEIHYAALFFGRSKTIVTVHDLGHFFRKTGVVGFILRCLYAHLPLRWAKHIVAISNFSKNEIVERVGVSPEKISVIYDPAPDWFEFSPKKLDLHCPTILCFCHMKNKNLTGIINAVKGLNCRLRIIGRISESDRELLEEYKISYSNDFDISGGQIIEEYKNCDILLFPSTYEGFGVPVLEAQLTGRPVITSDIEPLTEVAGDAAVFVNPFDSDSIRSGIVRLTENPDLSSELVKKGLENAKRFSPKLIASQYLEMYGKIAKSK